MTPVRFHGAALAELAHEAQYYGEVAPALAEKFVTAIEKAIAIASEFPTMGSPHKFGTRRVFPKRFPFSVVYLHRANEVFVVAIAPDHKTPGYWKARNVEA